MGKELNTKGEPWDKPNHISPIVLLEVEEGGYLAGWYHHDETEGLIGPFGTLEEAADAYRQYCLDLNGEGVTNEKA